jgi:hypothetical protein
MKMFSILLAVVLLFTAVFAISDEATLIDFTLLDTAEHDENGRPIGQNERTTIDPALVASTGYTEEQRAAMQSSLALGNWDVVLNASATNSASLQVSETRAAQVKDLPSVPEYFRGKSVLGVRVSFPSTAVNAQARIVPPFSIPAFRDLEGAEADTDTGIVPTQFEGGYGVLKNVGTIKEISVRVRGNLYPHYLYVLLQDQDGVEHRYPMGTLNFEGWKRLDWKNPSYVADVRKRAIQEKPLYPNVDRPYVKFVGFLVTKDAMNVGGDFISYFGDVRVIYDKAIVEKVTDIEEENVVWGIIAERETQKQNTELSRLGAKQVLQAAEKEKLATEDSFEKFDNPDQAQQ